MLYFAPTNANLHNALNKPTMAYFYSYAIKRDLM